MLNGYKKLLVFICLLIGVFSFQLQAEEGENSGRSQFLDITTLINLIQKARDAGYSEEDLAKINIQNGDRSINVISYLEELRQKERDRTAAIEAFLKKNFITVGDVFMELTKLQPHELTELREELLSE